MTKKLTPKQRASKAGKAGRGPAKVRGDSRHYAKLRAIPPKQP